MVYLKKNCFYVYRFCICFENGDSLIMDWMPFVSALYFCVLVRLPEYTDDRVHGIGPVLLNIELEFHFTRVLLFIGKSSEVFCASYRQVRHSLYVAHLSRLSVNILFSRSGSASYRQVKLCPRRNILRVARRCFFKFLNESFFTRLFDQA